MSPGHMDFSRRPSRLKCLSQRHSGSYAVGDRKSGERERVLRKKAHVYKWMRLLQEKA